MHFKVAISARNNDPSSSKTHSHFHSFHSPARIQWKLGIKGSRVSNSSSLIIFGSAPYRCGSYNRCPFRFIASVAARRRMTTCLVFGIVYGNRAVRSELGSHAKGRPAPSGGEEMYRCDICEGQMSSLIVKYHIIGLH